MERKKIVEVSNLKIRFREEGKETTFCDFTIEEGDFVLLKGRNGSGKSTFLKIVNNNFDSSKSYLDVVSGYVKYFGKDDRVIETTGKIGSADIEYLRRQIADVRQDDSAESWLSGYEVLQYTTMAAINAEKAKDDNEKKNKEELKTKLEELITQFYDGYPLDESGKELFSLQNILKGNKREFRRKSIRSYSGGQQKMIQVVAGLIKTMVLQTNLMILDEPANNLDGKNKYYLNRLFTKVRQENPKLAILMISHCHVFEGINKIIDVDYGESENKFCSSVLVKSKDLSASDLAKFETHHDCLEDCQLRRKLE